MKNPSRPSSALAIAASGRRLSGTAAQLRIIGQSGGWDQHIRSLMSGAANEAMENFWQKVVLNYTLTPYTEALPNTEAAPQSATTDDVYGQVEAGVASARVSSTSNDHGKH